MSTHAKLNANVRDVLGNSVRILRREGYTPAVVYSNSFKSLPIKVLSNELYKIYKETGKTHVIDLNIDGKVQPTIIKAVDAHPFKHQIRHVDFYAVDLKKEVTSEVPLKVVGVSPAVKELGAILNQLEFNLEVTALPESMPEEIEVDISQLKEFGDQIKVKDLVTKTKKFTIQTDFDTVLISLTTQSLDDEVVEEVQSTEEQKKEN
jgi:large subunit ribosomal protein L25